MLAGAVLGAYRVVKKLGAGGMGSVWIAEHTILGRRAALKVLHPDMSAREDIVKRFFNEARAATTIPDPGIVQIFDFGYHSDGSAYIVMELLDGEVLERRIERGRLDVAQALRLMRQVASTLGAAHARGIVHRDIKPDNIFIVKDPEVAGGERAKILDFGIAKLNDERRTGAIDLNEQATLNRTGVIGTPLYMSPEQREGKNVDARSDVYALGCVLYQMLTGRPPYDAVDLAQLIAMHLSSPVPLPSAMIPGIPGVVDDVVQCCMAKSASDRYASGTELAAALAEAAVRPSRSPAAMTTLDGPSPSGELPLPDTLRRPPRAASQPRAADQPTLRAHVPPPPDAFPIGDDEPTRAQTSQPIALANPAAKVTTLTGGIATVNRANVRTRPGVLLAAGLFTAAGAALVIWVVARSSITETPEPAAAPASSETAEATPTPEQPTAEQPTPEQPTPTPTPEAAAPAPAPDAELVSLMVDVLGHFREWAKSHADAPCPTITDLGASTTTDPWGQPLTLTCVDQPDGQQIGLISAGPDKQAGTDDDLRSWRLGTTVREAAQGTRWAADEDVTADTIADAAATKSQAAGTKAKGTVGVKKTKKTGTTATATTKTTATTKATTTKQTTPTTTIQLDANGIPIHR